MAVGYNNVNNTVYLIGGGLSNQLISFDVSKWNSSNTFDSFTSSFIPIHFYPMTAQAYTQKDNKLFIIQRASSFQSASDGYIYSFDLSSKQFEDPIQLQRDVTAGSGCLSHYDDYLMVSGGSNSYTSKIIQIYNNTLNGLWLNLSHIPRLQEARSQHACIVYNGYLYNIGGDVWGTVEKLKVSDMENIKSYSSNTIDGGARVYTEPMTEGQRAVIYNTDIYVIGDVVAIINTLTDKITITNTFTIQNQIRGSGVVIVDQRLYVFGGYPPLTFDTNLWQYFNLPTATPTSIPTSIPTTGLPTTSMPTTSIPTTSIPTTTIPTTTIPTTATPTIPTSKSLTTETSTTTTYITSKSPTIETSTAIISINSKNNEEKTETLSNLYSIISIIFISVFVMLGCVGYIDSKWVHKNDLFRISRIIICGLYSMDFISDIFFAATVFQNDIIIFICSMIFLLLPMILNLIQLKKSIIKWMDDKENGMYIVSYMSSNSKLLYLLTIMSGSGFASVNLLNSGLFRMKRFDMRLKVHQIEEFKNKRIWSVVLLENVPQIILQTIFAINNNAFYEITIMALIFSVCSIILSIFEYSTTKSIVKHNNVYCDVCIIKFDIICSDILKRRQSLKYQTAKINRQISEILEIDSFSVEQLRAKEISQGLKLMFRVSFDNQMVASTSNHNITTITREMKITNSINDKIKNGSLADSIKDIWKLINIPLIKNLEVIALKGIVNETELRKVGSFSNTMEINTVV